MWRPSLPSGLALLAAALHAGLLPSSAEVMKLPLLL